MKTHLMTCMKDEGPYILEWVSHHLAIGFQRIAIASNDCTDGTHELLDALAHHGFIEHVPITVNPKLGPAHTAFRLMHNRGIVTEADWLAVIDVDEFINIHIGEGQIQDLVNHYEEAEVLCLNWKCFGLETLGEWDASQSVLDNFVYAAREKSIRNSGVKSITKTPRNFRAINNHRPHDYTGKFPLIYANMNGSYFEYRPDDGPMFRYMRDFPRSKISHKHAQVNHYIVRSLPTFVLRRLRGLSFGNQDRYNLDFFIKYAGLAYGKDTSIFKYAPKRRLKMAEMRRITEIDLLQTQIETKFNHKLKAIENLIEEMDEIDHDGFEKLVRDSELALQNLP